MPWFDWQVLLTEACSVGLKPAEFWAMSFFEFNACMFGHGKHLRGLKVLAAWHAANIMNCWAEDGISPALLLGEAPQTRETTDIGEYQARMAAKKAKARMEDV